MDMFQWISVVLAVATLIMQAIDTFNRARDHYKKPSGERSID